MNFENLKEELTRVVGNLFKKDRQPDDQEHVMSKEEKIDESGKESFPASDPPARNSFTGEIKPGH